MIALYQKVKIKISLHLGERRSVCGIGRRELLKKNHKTRTGDDHSDPPNPNDFALYLLGNWKHAQGKEAIKRVHGNMEKWGWVKENDTQLTEIYLSHYYSKSQKLLKTIFNISNRIPLGYRGNVCTNEDELFKFLAHTHVPELLKISFISEYFSKSKYNGYKNIALDRFKISQIEKLESDGKGFEHYGEILRLILFDKYRQKTISTLKNYLEHLEYSLTFSFNAGKLEKEPDYDDIKKIVPYIGAVNNVERILIKEFNKRIAKSKGEKILSNSETKEKGKISSGIDRIERTLKIYWSIARQNQQKSIKMLHEKKEKFVGKVENFLRNTNRNLHTFPLKLAEFKKNDGYTLTAISLILLAVLLILKPTSSSHPDHFNNKYKCLQLPPPIEEKVISLARAKEKGGKEKRKLNCSTFDFLIEAAHKNNSGVPELCIGGINFIFIKGGTFKNESQDSILIHDFMISKSWITSFDKSNSKLGASADQLPLFGFNFREAKDIIGIMGRKYKKLCLSVRLPSKSEWIYIYKRYQRSFNRFGIHQFQLGYGEWCRDERRMPDGSDEAVIRIHTGGVLGPEPHKWWYRDQLAHSEHTGFRIVITNACYQDKDDRNGGEYEL